MQLQLAESFLAGFRFDGFITGAPEIDDQEAADAGFIFENQNLLHDPTSFQVEPLIHSE